MKVLIVGAGVIGTVYGAPVAAAGNQVSVLSHGRRTGEVAAAGLGPPDPGFAFLLSSPCTSRLRRPPEP